MAETFELEVATPERLLVHEQAVRAQIPGKEGYLGILPDHAPLLGELGIGVLTYVSPGGGKIVIAVHGGYLEVLNNHVRVLADHAEPATEIDAGRAEQELKQAQANLTTVGEAADPAEALAATLRAQARLEAVRKNQRGEE